MASFVVAALSAAGIYAILLHFYLVYFAYEPYFA